MKLVGLHACSCFTENSAYKEYKRLNDRCLKANDEKYRDDGDDSVSDSD